MSPYCQLKTHLIGATYFLYHFPCYLRALVVRIALQKNRVNKLFFSRKTIDDFLNLNSYTYSKEDVFHIFVIFQPEIPTLTANSVLP